MCKLKYTATPPARTDKQKISHHLNSAFKHLPPKQFRLIYLLVLYNRLHVRRLE